MAAIKAEAVPSSSPAITGSSAFADDDSRAAVGFGFTPAEGAPRQVMEDALLDQEHGEIGNAADHGQHEDRDEYHRGVRLALAEGEQVAEPHIASDQLAHHHADHREGRGDAQAGE